MTLIHVVSSRIKKSIQLNLYHKNYNPNRSDIKLIKTKPNICTDMSTDESKSIENKIIQTTNVALSIKIEKIKIK